MGFATRTEYTIELLRNPRAYNYIGRHYYATGFILASSFHEAALRLLLERWQQIDAVTADCIRFLFLLVMKQLFLSLQADMKDSTLICLELLANKVSTFP